RGIDPARGILARLAAAERDARRDLAVTAFGVLATLAGLAAATRPPSHPTNGERTPLGARALRQALAVRTLAAAARCPAAPPLLAASGSLAIARLLQGVPPSAELVAGNIHRVIELVVAVVQNA